MCVCNRKKWSSQHNCHVTSKRWQWMSSKKKYGYVSQYGPVDSDNLSTGVHHHGANWGNKGLTMMYVM